mmetsp:Transcript_21017/g.53668  ORF Transcript_21017/g.53668 Transcript_21017/m.53668 type:complete len:329 (-) Transcript_21017:523-1509(-)
MSRMSCRRFSMLCSLPWPCSWMAVQLFSTSVATQKTRPCSNSCCSCVTVSISVFSAMSSCDKVMDPSSFQSSFPALTRMPQARSVSWSCSSLIFTARSQRCSCRATSLRETTSSLACSNSTSTGPVSFSSLASSSFPSLARQPSGSMSKTSQHGHGGSCCWRGPRLCCASGTSVLRKGSSRRSRLRDWWCSHGLKFLRWEAAAHAAHGISALRTTCPGFTPALAAMPSSFTDQTRQAVFAVSAAPSAKTPGRPAAWMPGCGHGTRSSSRSPSAGRSWYRAKQRLMTASFRATTWSSPRLASSCCSSFLSSCSFCVHLFAPCASSGCNT